MTAQPPPKQQAIFPDLPRNRPLSKPDGGIDDYWLLFFDNLVMALQRNYGPEGLNAPPQQSSSITDLTEAQSQGAILYDTTNNVFKTNSKYTNQVDVDGNPIYSWFQMMQLVTGTGNPNGSVPGNLYQFFWDTTGHVLYICTTAGSNDVLNPPVAVWTGV